MTTLREPIKCDVRDREECNNCKSSIGTIGGQPHCSTIKDICFLGQSSKLCIAVEWTSPILSGGDLKIFPRDRYAPRIDIVWFLDVEETLGNTNFQELTDFIESKLDIKGIPNEFIKYIPYAAFEVETSDPSSKEIYSDCHNLAEANVSFKFVVIREIQTMNRKRAERIIRSGKELDGIQDIFLLTTTNIEDTLTGVKVQLEKHPFKIERKMVPFQEKLSKIGTELGFEVAHECVPSEFVALGSKKEIYTPRIDGAWFIQAPIEAVSTIGTLITKSEHKHIKDLYQILMIGFEQEKRTSSKHIAGSISNLAHHTYLGILLTEQKNLNKIQKIINNYATAWGFNNVFKAACL